VLKDIVIPRVEGMQEEMERGVKVLEPGCGGGTLMMRLAELYPNSRFTGVDVDRFGIERARRAVVEKGLEDRVCAELLGGDELSHHDEFDYVMMVVVLHEVKPEARDKLVANCYRALKKGGRIVNVDFPYPAVIEEFRQVDFERGIFDQYREMIMGHQILTRPQQEALITSAGFRNLERFSVGKGMFDVIIASKP
jgi:cyclopropane fatty-acyl-phospholipid synthase-like methyltransferase